MAKDTLREYLDAKNELDKAKKTVQEMIIVIAKVATALRRDLWHFVVTDAGIVFPAEVLAGASNSLKANEWPSAEQIAKNLTAMHATYRKAKGLWDSLSAPDRKNLAPPDSM
jgi:hypothetical protein